VGEMVDDQTANQGANPLNNRKEKRKKKSSVLEQ
jgi:hypothetical protein